MNSKQTKKTKKGNYNFIQEMIKRNLRKEKKENKKNGNNSEKKKKLWGSTIKKNSVKK